MRRKRLITVFLLLLLTFLMSGCTGRQLDEQLLVVILGLDKAEDGTITITAKVPASGGSGEESSGSGGSGSGSEKNYQVVQSSGQNWKEALTVLTVSMPRTLNFSQVREIVFSEDISKGENFVALYQDICSLPSVRSQAYVVICKGKAKECLSGQQAQIGSRLSKYIDQSFNNYERVAYVPTTTLGEGLSALFGSGSDPLFIYGATMEQEDQSSGQGQGAQQSQSSGQDPAQEQEKTQEAKPVGDSNKPADILPGKSNHQGLGKVDMLGGAMTDGKRVVGLLTGYETALWRLLKGNLNSGLTMRVGEIYVTVKSVSSASLSMNRSGGKVKTSVEILYRQGEKLDRQLAKSLLKEDLQALLEKMQRCGCDALGFGGVVKRSYLTLDEWKKADFKDMYKNADIEIILSVQFKVD